MLITNDLEGALADAKEKFGFMPGVRDIDGMAELGFEHEVLTFSDTFLEIVAPLDPQSSKAQIAASGAGGYMTVVQVKELEPLLNAASERGFAPLLNQVFQSQLLTQWHPKHFGTIAEFDQIDPVDSWHFAPAVFDRQATEVSTGIAGATLAVDDPEMMAERWGYVLGIGHRGTTIELADGPIEFIAAGGGPRGVRAVDVFAADPAQVGLTFELCDVEFRLIGSKEQPA